MVLTLTQALTKPLEQGANPNFGYKLTWRYFGTTSVAPLPLHMPMLLVRKTKKAFANFLRGFCRFPTKFQLFKE